MTMIDLNVEEMMTDDSLLADIPREGSTLDSESDEQEAPADSPTENAEEVQSPSQEGEEAEEEALEESQDDSEEEPKAEETLDANENVPFHKNPRWQKMREENEALKAKLDELSSKFTQVEEKVSGTNEVTSVPPEYQKAFGDNVEAYKNWLEIEQLREKELTQKILADIEAKKKAEESAIEQQQQAIQQNVEYIEETFGVSLPEKSSLRNEYMKFMWDVQPTTEGNLDFKKGWELFTQLRETKSVDKSASVARKKVVAKTASDPKAELPTPDVYELGQFIPNQFKQH